MDDGELKHLLEAPPPLVLLPSRTKWVLMLLVSVAFVAGCIYLLQEPSDLDKWIGWMGIAFFGLGIPLSLGRILFPQKYALVLNRQNFVINLPRRSQSFEWNRVSEFVVQAIPGDNEKKKAVFFDADATGKMAELARAFIGKTGVLGENYGLTHAQLAQLMNHWREKAISNNGN